MLKTLVMRTDEDQPRWVLAVLRGDHEANESKVKDAVGAPVHMADEKEAIAAGFNIGYVSPKMLDQLEVIMVIDPDAINNESWATGADEKDHHITGFNWSRDLPSAKDKAIVADIRNAQAGDPSPRADGAFLEAKRGIEVGHIFKLGTKYSEAMGLSVLNKDQKKQPAIMGCYGIGVSRTLASCIESSHDDNGIIMPVAIAPYTVHIITIKPNDEGVLDHAFELANELAVQGLDVLVDDRNERPGPKFKDADLIGIPLRIIVSSKTIEANQVEFKRRTDQGKANMIPRSEIIQTCLDAIAE
jgi:prolyl-tRNA synthetase